MWLSGVGNPDFKLKPGMTANVNLITAERSNVLKISNAALRFKMPEVKPPSKPAVSKEIKTDATTGTQSAGSAVAKTAGESKSKGSGIWILENDTPTRIRITTGISDGASTEVVSGDLREGQEVIVESLAKSAKSNGTSAGRSSGAPRFF